LKVVLGAAVAEYELERNPVLGVAPFDTSTHPAYSEEEPNSLTVGELSLFLNKLYELYPQFFAFAFLGFTTSLRPSSIRPLRRAGPTPDILWDEGVILVRRSQTRGDEVMETTKTARHQRITVPDELMAVLRWHVNRLPAGRMAESDLVFPSVTGGFLGPTTLLVPFDVVAVAIGLKKHITPRAMRRTFQDLARSAEVNDLVTRAVSGHATAAMQHHYSTVSASEVKAGLAKVISLAGFRRNLDAPSTGPGGASSGASTTETKTAGSGSNP
jgi:integrase